jgi:glyoxylase-like metal-dependent hydrolase (beta-lactamase superfamily II)
VNHRVSPEVSLFPTPGHTKGHVSVRIESEGDTAIITGDMIHHPCQITYPDWSPEFDADMEQSRATRRALVAQAADNPILIIGTHFAAPTAGHVVRHGEQLRFRCAD